MKIIAILAALALWFAGCGSPENHDNEQEPVGPLPTTTGGGPSANGEGSSSPSTNPADGPTGESGEGHPPGGGLAFLVSGEQAQELATAFESIQSENSREARVRIGLELGSRNRSGRWAFPMAKLQEIGVAILDQSGAVEIFFEVAPARGTGGH